MIQFVTLGPVKGPALSRRIEGVFHARIPFRVGLRLVLPS